ncbi:hypothetical protein FDECE_3790 [Fusarium decemcellulare]|nr:hypothetical protein FDECE_3790 [Fusarium decemcellulare]
MTQRRPGRPSAALCLLLTSVLLVILGSAFLIAPVLSEAERDVISPSNTAPIPDFQSLLGPGIPPLNKTGQKLDKKSPSDGEDEEQVPATPVPDVKYLLEPSVPNINDPSQILDKDSIVNIRRNVIKPSDSKKAHRQSVAKDFAGNIDGFVVKHGDHKQSLTKRLMSFASDVIKLGNRLLQGTPRDHAVELTLINATPYRWVKGYSHSHEMDGREENWPKYIQPGKVTRVVPVFESPFNSPDTAGEVVYHLEDTSKPMSIRIERRVGEVNSIYVKFQGHLKTAHSPTKSEFKLDWPRDSQWVLGGVEGKFFSVDTPIDWMAQELPYIGDLSLREIVMPRSHHAGLYKVSHQFGLGDSQNSITHDRNLTYQLVKGGVRVLDFRPFLLYTDEENITYAGHGSIVAGKYHGVLGASLREMVDQVNDFNEKYPGELIIWDIHPNHSRVSREGNDRVISMTEAHRSVVYDELRRLKHRVDIPDDEDLTKWPLEQFIGNRTSAVMVRVDHKWTKDQEYPGGENGFITARSFPVDHVWVNKQDLQELVEAQSYKLKELKTSRHATLYSSDWVITMSGIDSVIGAESLLARSLLLYRTIWYELWGSLTSNRWPNWIALDGIYSEAPKNFARTLNRCLSAQQCGRWEPKRQ